MNNSSNSMHAKPQQHHKPTNSVYRKAILKAIEDLHDCQLRSNVDSIRRHVQSTIQEEMDHTFNEVLFVKTLKSVVHEGEIEQGSNTCALSPEYKRRRSNSLTAYTEHHLQYNQNHPPPTSVFVPALTGNTTGSITSTGDYHPTPQLAAAKRKVEDDNHNYYPITTKPALMISPTS